jgi:hypothetical protein
MVSTFPSESFFDFLEFAAAFVGPRFLDKAIGATEEQIRRFGDLCGHPLPRLYVDYLHHFGTSDGGLRLMGDAEATIGELINHYERQGQKGFTQQPPRCVLIGLESLSGGIALKYDQNGQPSVVVTWDNSVGATRAQCFRNFLYSATFLRGLFRGRPCDVLLKRESMQAVGKW